MILRTGRAASAAACVLAASSAFADDKDDRIERLEKDAAEMRKELAELKAQRASPVEVSAVRAAVDDYLAHADAAGPSGAYVGPGGARRPGGRVTLGGYFSTRYVSSNEPGSMPSFVDMRLVPQIHADVTDRIAFDSEIEWEHGGVSDEIHGEIEVEYAALSFRWSDAFTLRVGTLLVPFGAFNQNHDDPMNELSTRPSVDFVVVPSAFAVPGIGVAGAIEAGDDATVTYDAVLTNGLRDEFDGEEGSRPARGLFDEDDNHNKTVFGRVGFVPTVEFLDVLNVGASGALGAVGAQSDRLRGYGFDAAGKHGPWEFKGEYDKFGIDRPDGSAPPIDDAGRLGLVRGMYGWYAQALYRFTDAWVRSLPFSEKDASLALVLRRDHADVNDRVHGAGPVDDERGWSFGVTYHPTSKTAVKIEFRKASSGAAGDVGEKRDLVAVEFASYF